MKTTVLNYGGVKYQRQHEAYCWQSMERGVKPGSVRVIDGVLSYASCVIEGGPFCRDTILWSDAPAAKPTETPSKKGRK